MTRAEELFEELRDANYRRTSHLFAVLMVVQWVFAVGLALVVSPHAWAGKVHAVHLHVWIAIFLGGAISSLPILFALTRPTAALTRYTVAAGQMMWSALLIHLTGGRIETHFHVFGSLAFLAFYRDWKVLLPATVVVATDHLARQMFWPESVFGILNPEWWRFLEHALWVVFEDIILITACIVMTEEMRGIGRARADAEAKSRALQLTMDQLATAQEARLRGEKLAAVGQLAASVGHELRNPLTAVRNANAFIGKKIKQANGGAADAKVVQFSELIERELDVCTKIIGDLLDFARDRPLTRAPTPLRSLVEEALSVLPPSKIEIVNKVQGELPIPDLDKEQFRQVLINLTQNAVEALEPAGVGRVTLSAAHQGATWQLVIEDNGPGMSPDVVAKIFEPLFTTKVKGTGLGLAIVAGIVKRHGGTLQVDSKVGRGTKFVIEWPDAAAPVATTTPAHEARA